MFSLFFFLEGKIVTKGLGSGRGTPILCQNDQLGTPEGLGQLLTKHSWENQRKIKNFWIVFPGLWRFPRWPVTNGWVDWVIKYITLQWITHSFPPTSESNSENAGSFDFLKVQKQVFFYVHRLSVALKIRFVANSSYRKGSQNSPGQRPSVRSRVKRCLRPFDASNPRSCDPVVVVGSL